VDLFDRFCDLFCRDVAKGVDGDCVVADVKNGNVVGHCTAPFNRRKLIGYY